VGNGDRALDYHLRINPSAREVISSLHRCEPYVYAQMIAGRDATSHGEAKNSWLTGTAAWSYVALTQWILGVRPDYDGLRVEPCLPSTWDGFTMRRLFRSATYAISVRRDPSVNGLQLLVDGRAIGGSVVPAAPSGSRVSVEVLIGS
jgi:cellobiose phosphorylase